MFRFNCCPVVLLFGLVLCLNPAASGQLDAVQGPADRHGDPLPASAVARVGTLRFRHPTMHGHFHIAFAADGKVLASTGIDGSIWLWDVATGRRTAQFAAEVNPDKETSPSIAFSPDGKLLAQAPTMGKAFIRDATTGKLLRSVGHDNDWSFSCLAFAPDGKTLAVGRPEPNGAGLIQFVDVAAGAVLRRIDWKHEILAVTYSVDGKLLASGLRKNGPGKDAKRTAVLWDVNTGQELRAVDGILSDQDQPFRPGQDQQFRFSADGRWLAVLRWGGIGAEVSLVDAATGKLVRKWQAGFSSHSALAFSPDGKMLATTDRTAIRLWDVATGKEVRPRGHGPIACATLSADGRTLAWAPTNSGTTGYRGPVHVWHLSRGEEVHQLQGPPVPAGRGPSVKSLALSGDGRTLAVGGSFGIQLWDLPAGKLLHQMEERDWVNCISLSPDGTHLASTTREYLRLWDVASGREVSHLHLNANSDALAFSPDGKALAINGSYLDPSYLDPDATYRKPSIRLLDTATGKERGRLVGREERSLLVDHGDSIAFSPDGRTFAAVGRNGPDGTIWELTSGRERWRLRGSSIAYSPDGKTLAAGANDGAICLWDTATGQQRSRLEGHRGRVVSLAFSADGRTLVSGSADTTILVWDAARLVTPPGPPLKPIELETDRLEALWSDLAAVDAARAFRAMAVLRTSPRQASAWLGKHVRPVSPIDPRRLTRLVADLDHDKFEARQAATEELRKLGEVAEPALRRVLADNPPLEVRQRVEKLLDYLDPLPGETLRELRAVELLEIMATPEARQVLDLVARGAEGARLTREARASLHRLAVPDAGR